MVLLNCIRHQHHAARTSYELSAPCCSYSLSGPTARCRGYVLGLRRNAVAVYSAYGAVPWLACAQSMSVAGTLAALSGCVGAYCSAGTWRGVASTVVANTTGRDVGACLRASRIAETTPRPPCGGNAVAPLDRNAPYATHTISLKSFSPLTHTAGPACQISLLMERT